MDWFPLLNSLRIAAISAGIVFFLGVAAAYYIAKLPRLVKGVLDVALTLPLVLPPTVVGYLLLCVLGPRRVVGAWALEQFAVNRVPVCDLHTVCGNIHRQIDIGTAGNSHFLFFKTGTRGFHALFSSLLFIKKT